MQHRLVIRHVLVALAGIVLVGDAYLPARRAARARRAGDRQLAARVQPLAQAHHHEIEPARTPAPARVRAVLLAPIDEQRAHLGVECELGGERTAADASCVRLHDAHHALDRARSDAGTGAHAARHGVARGHEGIGAVIEVEVGGLGALEQHPLPGVERAVQEVHGEHDERLEARQHREVALRRARRRRRGSRL